MKTRTWRWGALALMLGVLMVATLSPAGAASKAANLSPAEQDALEQAIEEEYLALNTYLAVIGQYGNVTPFSNVSLSEQQHVAALSQLFVKYGLDVPGNPGLSPTPTWPMFQAACQTGVDAEIHDIALYDDLLPAVKNKRDIVRVFTNLQTASYSHLAAFEACAFD